MAKETRGQWILCIQDQVSGHDDYVGPFHSEKRADEVARRLRRNIKAIGAEEQVGVVIEWCRPALEIEEIRDELIRDYGEQEPWPPQSMPSANGAICNPMITERSYIGRGSKHERTD